MLCVIGIRTELKKKFKSQKSEVGLCILASKTTTLDMRSAMFLSRRCAHAFLNFYCKRNIFSNFLIRNTSPTLNSVSSGMVIIKSEVKES